MWLNCKNGPLSVTLTSLHLNCKQKFHWVNTTKLHRTHRIESTMKIFTWVILLKHIQDVCSKNTATIRWLQMLSKSIEVGRCEQHCKVNGKCFVFNCPFVKILQCRPVRAKEKKIPSEQMWVNKKKRWASERQQRSSSCFKRNKLTIVYFHRLQVHHWYHWPNIEVFDPKQLNRHLHPAIGSMNKMIEKDYPFQSVCFDLN